jgi:GTP-binding protein EngB required for normal cell division
MNGHEELATNALIIGKTGVGKSTFINYLYPDAARETGTGKPVTGRGIYRSVMRTENGLAVNLYDTWGLEANRSAEWKNVILDEVKRHDKENICDWFHTITYCLSAKSARVEKFETEQINALRAGRNRIMVVLTHCDLNNVWPAIEKMSEILRAECGLTEDDIVCVSSVNKKLLGGTASGPFGRERAIERMVSDLWGSIAEKIPPALLSRGMEMIDGWREEADAVIEREIHFFNRLSNDAIKSAIREINDGAKICRDTFSRRAEKTLREALGYYRVFAEKYLEFAADGFGAAAKGLPCFHCAEEEMSAEDKAIDILACVVFPIVLPFVAEYKRDELKEKLNGYEARMREWLEGCVEEIRARLLLDAEDPAEERRRAAS